MPAASAVRTAPVRLAARRRPGNADGELESLAADLRAVPPSGMPATWLTPGFAGRVDSARRQLRAAQSRQVLALSFEREACRLGPATAGAARRTDAVRAAYALRWLELVDGVLLAAWSDWLDGAEAQTGRL